jgi:hypothetical protein
MTKNQNVAFMIISIIAVLLLLLTSCNKQLRKDEHACRYDDCPYKGVNILERKAAIINFTMSEEGSNTYALESLHFLCPDASDEELKQMLLED